ncbi:MAG: thioredoxin [Pseudomonadota bacterium]|nr:thioredoxin [Pseudomonadota bacterium]
MNIMENSIEDIDTTSFIEKVVQESKNIGIIVDFWAPWCEPCKQITPILEQLTNFYKGKVKLAKINIDENQQLAQQLNIQSIPTVMAFYEGQPINGFTGLKSPEEIKSFFQEIVSSTSVSSKLMDDINKKLEEAFLFLEEKEVDKAMGLFSDLISQDLPKSEMGKAMSGLGKCLLESNKIQELDELLGQLEDEMKDTNEIKELIEARNFFSSIMEVCSKSKNNLNNALEDNLQSARRLILDRDYQKSVNIYLAIIEKNSNWNDGIAKNELLRLFSFLGNNNKITISGRSKLLNILYK